MDKDMSEVLLTVLENVDIWLHISDYYTGEVLFASQKFADYIHAPITEIVGRSCWSLINQKDEGRCAFCPYRKLIDDKGKPKGKYIWELQFPSDNMWVKVVNEVINWVDGRLVNIAAFYDITDAKIVKAQLEDFANFDQLLRLKNLTKFKQDITESVEKPYLIAFDIQSLHKMNELYGRDIGDRLLAAIRDWVLSCNIPNSSLYRIGGDEFCLAIYQSTPEIIRSYADTLYQRFGKPWSIGKNLSKSEYFCMASIAIISKELILDADTALTLIDSTLKTARANHQVTEYTDQLMKNNIQRLELELSLRECLNRDMEGFYICFQPIVNSSTLKWFALEVLCRWNSPELGTIPPSIFIAEAERLNIIEQLSDWIIANAISKCKQYGLDKRESFLLCVNVSAVQLSSDFLVQRILKTLRENNYPGSKLCVEITESTKVTFNDYSLESINLLRANGILIALDDFGTGYSNFSNLKNLPVDILKIEQAFVSNIENDEYQQYLFHAMVDLAHTANLKLIAEGVETISQMKYLRASGADLLQGFHFSKPMTSKQLECQLNKFS